MLPERPLRASDADREATVERLRTASLEGRLDSEELAARISDAYDARWCHELDQLTHDVTPPAAAAAPAPPRRPLPIARTNPFAVASLVCGLLWMWWFGSVAAVVFGHVALRQIARHGGAQAGRGLAIAGLTLGYLGVTTMVFVMVAVGLL